MSETRFNPTIVHQDFSVSAEEFGKRLANSDNHKQGAILAWFADAVVKWPYDWSWQKQCLRIAEEMEVSECAAVAELLQVLAVELQAKATGAP